MNSLKKFLGQFNRYDYVDQSGCESCCLLWVDPFFEFIIISDALEENASGFVCFHLESIIPQVFSSFDLNPQTAIYERILSNREPQSPTQSDDLTAYENAPLLRIHVTFSEKGKEVYIQEWEMVSEL